MMNSLIQCTSSAQLGPQRLSSLLLLATFTLAAVAQNQRSGHKLKGKEIVEESKVRVSLVDGSRILGQVKNANLKIDIGFGRVNVPMERVRFAEWRKDGSIRVTLDNYDVISGAIHIEPIVLATLFGTHNIDMKHVCSLDVIPARYRSLLPSFKGVVLYFPFDAAEAGNMVRNQARGEMHARNINAVWTKGGQRGGGIRFNGNGRLEIADHPALRQARFTVAAWIRPDASNGSWQIIAAKTSPSSWNNGFGIVRSQNGDRGIRFFVNNYSQFGTRAPIQGNRWTHLVGVFDGKTGVFYVNGEESYRREVAAKSGSLDPFGGGAGLDPFGAPSTPAPASDDPFANRAPQPPKPEADPSRVIHTRNPFLIGGSQSGYNWKGTMDDIVIYDRVLSAKEVNELYEATRGNSDER